LPHTFDCGARLYIRRNGDELWSGASFKPVLDRPPGVDGLEAEWVEAAELARRIAHRVPALAGLSFTRAWAGAIEITTDNNPIVGWTHLDNVYTAAGFSGHGICLGIGLAASICAEIQGAEPPIPLDVYRLDRFTTGAGAAEGLWTEERATRYEQWAGGAAAVR
jgi:glycine/D-amino acid oxidase-like deaminating enzyme